MSVKFYKSFNSLYRLCFKFSEILYFSEMHYFILLMHIASYTVCLLYGVDAVNPSNRELNTLNHHLYADDTQLFISLSPASFSTSIAHLLSVVNQISQWMSSNLYSASTLPKQNSS